MESRAEAGGPLGGLRPPEEQPPYLEAEGKDGEAAFPVMGQPCPDAGR